MVRYPFLKYLEVGSV